MTRRRSLRAGAPRRDWRAALVVLLLTAACSRGGDDGIAVRVRRVAFDPASHAPVVLLEDIEHGVALPIWIGPSEAQAIATHLEGEAPQRPQTHDLVKNAFERLGVGLRRVVIRALEDNTYFADLVLERDGEEVVIDSRPSDAIALAVRFDQPIFVERALFAREAVVDLRGAERDDVLAVDGVTVQGLSPALAQAFDLPIGQGVLVSDVASGAGGGLRRGDVVLEVDGAPVRDTADFRARMHARAAGHALGVQRDGERLELMLAD
ncbi:MAG: bifunctional nuclease domain-containing protein [Deltaproteobacteria bacterium]|nr:bifunctional nuclease domain-containing protein [Deltaproteobacteria bacterium]